MPDAVARDLRCPDLGLRLARGQDLSILGLPAPATRASSTVPGGKLLERTVVRH
jgi:hypothetical protein